MGSVLAVHVDEGFAGRARYHVGDGGGVYEEGWTRPPVDPAKPESRYIHDHYVLVRSDMSVEEALATFCESGVPKHLRDAHSEELHRHGRVVQDEVRRTDFRRRQALHKARAAASKAGRLVAGDTERQLIEMKRRVEHERSRAEKDMHAEILRLDAQARDNAGDPHPAKVVDHTKHHRRARRLDLSKLPAPVDGEIDLRGPDGLALLRSAVVEKGPAQ